MKKKKVRFLAALLAATMITSLAGCGKSGEDAEKDVEKATPDYVNETGRRICDETITVTMTGRQGATKDWQSTDQIKQIKEQFGIDIQCKPISNDAWETQRTLMFSSDTLPDIVVNAKMQISDANKYGEQGYLLPINKYLDYMPNLKAIMEKYPNYEKAITAPDGNIYGITMLNSFDPPAPSQLNRVYINKTWLENVGMEAPETLDELYEVLKAFKEQDANGNGDPNDEIPMMFNEEVYWYVQMSILDAYGIHSTQLDCSLSFDENEELFIGNLDEGYKEFLRYMNKLYSEGLIDVECFTLKQQDVESKARENLYGVIGTTSSPAITCGLGGEADFDWEIIPTFTLNEGDEKVATIKQEQIATTMNVLINANTEYPEAICRLIDYFYSDEGTLSSTQGFEGTGVEFVEVPFLDGVETAQLLWNKEDGTYKNAGEFRQQFSVIEGAFKIYVDSWMKPEGIVREADEETYEKLRSQDVATHVANGFSGWMVFAEDYLRYEDFTFAKQVPPLVYSSEEASEVSTLLTDLSTYFKVSRAQFITGELDVDKDWDGYVEKANAMGAERLLELQKATYERMYK